MKEITDLSKAVEQINVKTSAEIAAEGALHSARTRSSLYNACMQLYLDYNATTPIAPSVKEAMLPFLAEHYGNRRRLGRARTGGGSPAARWRDSSEPMPTKSSSLRRDGSNNLAIKRPAAGRSAGAMSSSRLSSIPVAARSGFWSESARRRLSALPGRGFQPNAIRCCGRIRAGRHHTPTIGRGDQPSN